MDRCRLIKSKKAASEVFHIIIPIFLFMFVALVFLFLLFFVKIRFGAENLQTSKQYSFNASVSNPMALKLSNILDIKYDKYKNLVGDNPDKEWDYDHTLYEAVYAGRFEDYFNRLRHVSDYSDYKFLGDMFLDTKKGVYFLMFSDSRQSTRDCMLSQWNMQSSSEWRCYIYHKPDEMGNCVVKMDITSCVNLNVPYAEFKIGSRHMGFYYTSYTPVFEDRSTSDYTGSMFIPGGISSGSYLYYPYH